MDYNTLLELAADLGYRLAMNGAETFRVEESITLLLKAYGLKSETFAIPNCLTVSIETPDGKPMTRMRRIGFHGNDLDSVERYSNLSRRICAQCPEPKEAVAWMKQTDAQRVHYSVPAHLLGAFLGAGGFALFFGAGFRDSLISGLCGIVIGILGLQSDKFRVNQFFRTIISAFVLGSVAYLLSAAGLVRDAGSVIIGALMILVPGLLFTNAMRDIIYGDTNSGINRIVQVFLIAAAIALGTASAWNVVSFLCGTPSVTEPCEYGMLLQLVACGIGCIGFSILFNIHGITGISLCVLGGVISWAAYLITIRLNGDVLTGYLWAGMVASAYSETMARIRKCPAISYLVVAIFPLIPGASVYYTMNYAVRGDMDMFSEQGMLTIGIAGSIAVGLLLVSTCFRAWTNFKRRQIKA